MHSFLRGAAALVTVLALLALLSTGGCGSRSFEAGEQDLRTHWADLVAAHRHRAELAPALVSAVRGQPGIADDAVAAVVQARARVASLSVSGRQLPGPEALREYQRSQATLGRAMAQLLAMSETHPALATDPRFTDLRHRLDAAERALASSRSLYVHAVQDFNVRLKGFPTRLAASALGYQPQPTLPAEDEAGTASAAP